jgi:hypothetical protein
MKRKVSEELVSQTINLKDLIGDVANEPSIKEAFAQAAIDKIVERTQSGRDVNGNLFAPYSKLYKESLAFNVFGKSNKVNLTLTGSMLSSINPDTDTSNIKLQIDDSTEAAKAYGHITGFKGHPTIKNAKPRDFFGLTEKELKQIAKDFKPDLSREAQRNDEVILKKLLKLIG